MGFISEFKEFAMKGNVLDMAVGVIIGGAFGKIVCTEVWHLHPEHGRLRHCCILYLPHAEGHQQDEP